MKRVRSKPLTAAAALAAFVFIAALLAPVPAQAQPGAAIPGDGVYVVGVDIQPGIYVSSNPGYCSWYRLSGLSGGTRDIIASDNTAAGKMYVTIAPTDVAFKTLSCATWQLVSAAAPSAMAPSASAPQPQANSPVALNVSSPIARPACDGTGIVVLGSVTTPGQYDAGVQSLLNANPGASYLRTDQSCPSLRQATETGGPIYAVYRAAGKSQSAVCAAVAAAGGKAYGKWLDTTTDPGYIIPC